ncbi:hypothetical protein ACWGID_12745 [Kribbella sp. NPDC054772]
MQLGREFAVRLARGAQTVIGHRGVRVAALMVAVAVSLWHVDRVPHTAVLPAVLGLVPFAIGKCILCPLR